MADDIHIRCSHCQLHLAGPLSHVESRKGRVAFGDFAVGFNEFFSVREILFSTNDLDEFTFESEDDLYIHPQWYDGWRRHWPDFAQGAVTRRLFAVAQGHGCCGPRGTVECRCGVQLGRVMADCIGSQWMVFFDSRVDRSDQHDGHWTIHSDAEKPTQWYEDFGERVNNRRHGEWERWLVVPYLVPVQRRNKNHEPVTVNEERFDRRLVGYAQWAKGELIGEIVE